MNSRRTVSLEELQARMRRRWSERKPQKAHPPNYVRRKQRKQVVRNREEARKVHQMFHLLGQMKGDLRRQSVC